MADEHATSDDTQQLVLVKKTQKWVFRYRRGQENSLLRQLADHARDPQCDFDWFDAAVLSHQLGDRLGQRLKTLIQRKAS
jgi:hypothetical protein